MGWEYRPDVQGTYLLEVEAGQAVGVAGAQRSSSPEGVITASRASILASCQCHTPDTLNRTTLCLDVLALLARPTHQFSFQYRGSGTPK